MGGSSIKSSSRLVLKAAFVVSLAVNFPNQTNAQPSDPLTAYEIEGAAQHIAFTPKGEISGIPIVFTLSIHDCIWSLKWQRDEPNGFDYEQVTYDGQSLYYISVMRAMIEKAKAAGKKLESPNVANAFVSKGEIFHHPMAPEMGSVWLAYGSGCFFATKAKTNIMEPPLSYDGTGWFYDTKLRKLQAVVDYSTSALGVPDRVDFFDDGISMHGNRRHAPYDKGFTNSTYKVESWTNIHGVSLPSSASMNLYRPKTTGATSSDLELAGQYRISLRGFKLQASDFSDKPELPGVTMVFDLRLPDSPSVVYPTTNKWPSVEEILAHPEYKKAMRVYHKDERPRSGSRKPVVVMLLLSANLLAFLMIMNAFKRKNTKNKKSE